MIFVVNKYGNFSLYLKKTSYKTVVMATAWQVSFCSPFDLDWWCQVCRSLREKGKGCLSNTFVCGCMIDHGSEVFCLVYEKQKKHKGIFMLPRLLKINMLSFHKRLLLEAWLSVTDHHLGTTTPCYPRNVRCKPFFKSM